MRTVAIVQARMGSTRLPGKVLAPLAGRPMLERVINRTRRASRVDGVVVATTRAQHDEPLAELAGQLGVHAVRGSEHDVLSRYAAAADELDAEIIVRITSDCPFVCPEIVDQVVKALHSPAAPDYASNVFPHRTFPRGLDVEAFTRAALIRADDLDRDPATREHVTPFIHHHPELYATACVEDKDDWSGHRWTVDTAADLALAQSVYAHFNSDRFDYSALKRAFSDHPEWQRLNNHIDQKAIP